MDNDYDDIINLPHYISKKHPQMSIEARSAQFAPFSALTGYDEAIKETARLTDKRIEIDDGLKVVLNNKLQYILENLKLKPEIILTYFVYDDKKIGGKYVEKIGIVKKIDMVEQYVMLIDKTKIPVLEIINITGEIFNSMEDE